MNADLSDAASDQATLRSAIINQDVLSAVDGASCALCSECLHKSVLIFLSVPSVPPALLGVTSALPEEADLQRLLLTEFSGCAQGAGWGVPLLVPWLFGFAVGCGGELVLERMHINASSEKSPDDRCDDTDTGEKLSDSFYIMRARKEDSY